LNCIYLETSAKTGENISKVFDRVAEKLPKKKDLDDAEVLSFAGSNNQEQEQNTSKCC
jgi:translation elongation factor EF-4